MQSICTVEKCLWKSIKRQEEILFLSLIVVRYSLLLINIYIVNHANQSTTVPMTLIIYAVADIT